MKITNGCRLIMSAPPLPSTSMVIRTGKPAGNTDILAAALMIVHD